MNTTINEKYYGGGTLAECKRRLANDYYRPARPMLNDLLAAADECERLQKVLLRSLPYDPSLSDAFELREGSVFVVRNGIAYLAGVRELGDLEECDRLRVALASALRREQDQIELRKLNIEQSDKLRAELVAVRENRDHCHEKAQQLRAENERLRAKCEEIIAQQPCCEGGGCFYPMHDGEGNYIGEQHVDPLGVIQGMVDTALRALEDKP